MRDVRGRRREVKPFSMPTGKLDHGGGNQRRSPMSLRLDRIAVLALAPALALGGLAGPASAAHLVPNPSIFGVSLNCVVKPHTQTSSFLFLGNPTANAIPAGAAVRVVTDRNSSTTVVLPWSIPAGGGRELDDVPIFGYRCTAHTGGIMAIPPTTVLE
jgi:hypothetical protein